MSIHDRLKELNISLPTPGSPIAAYVPAVRTGNLIFVSGQLPRVSGAVLYPGKVGAEVTLEQAQEAARAAVINALAVLKAELADLESIGRVVRLNGYVASSPDFVEQSKVIDGASLLLQEIFEEAGKHSRIAVGVASLPVNAPVEIDLIVEVRTPAGLQ